MWWQMLLWGVAGAILWTVALSVLRWLVLAWMDARTQVRRERLAQQAVADPQAVADRLGLPVDAVKRYADGYRPD